MFFDQPEILKILQEEYSWTDADIEAMRQSYTNSITKLIMDESILYIEHHNLPEQAKFRELLHSSKVTRGSIETETKLIRFIAELPTKYPKLAKLLADKIHGIDDSLASGMFSGLSEQAGIEVLKIINRDLDNINSYSDKFLNTQSAVAASEQV